ncbi:hypothetical protein Tco_0830205, partial [Tanacetum coccineum]
FTPDPNSQHALPNDDTCGTFDECNSQYSDNNSESKSDVEDDSDDGSDDGIEVAAQSHSQGVMDFMNGVDVEYPMKNIQADIKNKLNVDVSYWKVWHSRQKSIETLYGTWESNFDMLPEHIAALEASNPNTVVKWFHDPHSSANVVTFKYIFLAFGPGINAFHLCPPIISIDDAHLKGSYKGKQLVAVDISKINVSRGRKKSSRIRNEMDMCHTDEPKNMDYAVKLVTIGPVVRALNQD